jgi:hypothetical protein
MRIEFERQGGFGHFPGRRVAGEVDTNALAPDETRDLEALVHAASFFTLPAHVGDPHRLAADARTYAMTVSDRDRRHRVHVTEPVEDPALAELIAAVERRLRGRSPGR